MRWYCPSPVRYYYPLRISRLIADVRSCFADVLTIAPRRHTACSALDRSLLAAPLPLCLRDAGTHHAVRFLSPTHPHLYVLVECMCQAPPGLGGVVLPLGSLGPSTGSREPSRVRPRLLDPTPLRRAARRDWHVTSRKRRDMPIPPILPTFSRVEASNDGCGADFGESRRRGPPSRRAR